MSLETPEKIRNLQRKLYCKAKAQSAFRFYLLYDKICCRFRFQCETGDLPRDFFRFNWDWNVASVPIETEYSVRSGEDSLSFKCGFPALHILVGDLLLSGPNRFHGELVEHAEDFCGYAVRCPCKRSQA